MKILWLGIVIVFLFGIMVAIFKRHLSGDEEDDNGGYLHGLVTGVTPLDPSVKKGAQTLKWPKWPLFPPNIGEMDSSISPMIQFELYHEVYEMEMTEEEEKNE